MYSTPNVIVSRMTGHLPETEGIKCIKKKETGAIQLRSVIALSKVMDLELGFKLEGGGDSLKALWK